MKLNSDLRPQQSMPLVSIIIPTHNRGEWLRDAVDSALAQTWPAVEVIVVDDGSTDGTAGLLAAYQDRVRVVHQDNQGVSAARNHGLGLAQGQYVTFLDDDDLIFPEKIAKQMTWLQKNPSCRWVHSRYWMVDSDKRPLTRVGLLPEGEVLTKLVCQNFLWMGAPLMEKELVTQAGGFNPRYSAAADFELWLRLAALTPRLGCVQEPLGAYRLHGSSMVTNIHKLEQEIIAILDAFFAQDNLPTSVMSARPDAYAEWLLWLAMRYAASDSESNAARCIHSAIQAKPSLASDPWPFLERAAKEAMDARVKDARAYLGHLIASLPAPWKGEPHRQFLYGRLGLLQSLQALREQDFVEARRLLQQASQHFASRQALRTAFASEMVHACMTSPGNPFDLLDAVYSAAVRPALQAFLPRRSQVENGILIAGAFEQYHNQHYAKAFRQALKGVVNRPAWLFNRGVVSMLYHSALKGE